MLVLGRQVDEEVCIGDDIKITIVRIEGCAVRIGIEAPREVAIWRPESKRRISARRYVPESENKEKRRSRFDKHKAKK